ncbi:MAG: dehydrogenase (flavoprotein) [uncultured bacterium]|nr:MAG: dehydrogenase (flavoprotein) [uncultured bacterium]HCU70936.1 hypothetical protein [Candidatus Moranbacteria bacterium]
MEYRDKYDVVIVGAGPGGLRCAEVLGASGKNVLIIEKNEMIGPKICAGGLTRKAISYLHNIGMPEDIIENTFDGIVFRKGGMRTRINFGSIFLYTINRKNLGQWQLGKLHDMKNVAVSSGTMVTKITKEHVIIGKSQKIQYDFLVGADGSNSIVRRFLGIPTKRLGVAYQYIMPLSKKFSDIEIIFESNLFHAWYAWIFPYAKTLSIGTGYFPKIMPAEKSKKKFMKWLDKEKISIENVPMEAHPINCDYRGHHFGNVFLAGDAAGATSGFSGEGIYQALIFGGEIAQIILNPQHKSKKISEVLREKRIHEAMLLFLILSGPFRNCIFYLVVSAVRIPWCGRILLRIMS